MLKIKSAARKLLPPRSIINYKKNPILALLYIFRVHKVFKFLCGPLYTSFKIWLVKRQFSSPSACFNCMSWQNHDDDGNYEPLVTVIVPNYNHAPFLAERLDSIYGQSYRNFEVLLMDDASGDGSADILKDYANRYPDKTRLLLNSANSGSPFAQWRKGLEHANGKLIWIAESDDYCELDFLEKLVEKFRVPAVMLAFSRSLFVKNGSVTWSIEEYLKDGTFASGSFMITASNCVKEYFFLRNIIPNVSSCVFRKPVDMKLLEDPDWNRMKVCGDWVFYLHLIKGGAVAYTAETTNYYRQHDSNTSVSQHSLERYYLEHQIVREHLAENYIIPKRSQRLFKDAMRDFWKHNRGDYSDAAFDRIFDDGKVEACAVKRSPAIAMLCYAFSSGGGEKVPMVLANALKRHGYSITFINCGGAPELPGEGNFLDADIPIVNLDWCWENLPAILFEFGIDCIHTHHASVDFAATQYLPRGIAHVVTTHGMYETMPQKYLRSNLTLLVKNVDLWLYIADKNLDTMRPYISTEDNFKKTFNAVIPPRSITSGAEIRKKLDIADDDFMIAVVSRGIPEKGWQEAFDAVAMARKASSRDIKIVFVGDGPEYERMKQTPSDFARFVGFSHDIYSYFSAADLALLPSRFVGESFPLVILEAFAVDTPVIATDIGESKDMLTTPDGFAGEIIPVHDWRLDVSELKDAILHFVDDAAFYRRKKDCVSYAKKRFSIDKLVEDHEKFYAMAIRHAKEKLS